MNSEWPDTFRKQLWEGKLCLCSVTSYLDCDLESGSSTACLWKAASFSTAFLHALIRKRRGGICRATSMKFKHVSNYFKYFNAV